MLNDSDHRKSIFWPEAPCESALVSRYDGHPGLGADRGRLLRKARVAHGTPANDAARNGNRRDSVPRPWGPRIEFVFREIGGFVWLQITLIVVLLRMILSGIASVWRLFWRRDPPL